MTDANTDSSASADTGADIIVMFAEEAGEQLETLERLLLGVETECSRSTLDEAFRAMHSIKGNAGCLGLGDIETVAHRAEDVLDGLRKGVFPVGQALVSAVLGAVDAIRRALVEVDRGGVMPEREAVLAKLQAELEAANPRASVPRLGELLVDRGAVASKDIDDVVDFQRRPLGQLLVSLGVVEEGVVEESLAEQRRLAEAAAAAPAPPVSVPQPVAEVDEVRATRVEQSFVRVDTHRLDTLLDQVGELISAVSAVVQSPDTIALEGDRFTAATAQLARVTSGLHDAAMAMRMVPLSGVVNKLHRVVRDLRIKLGKQVELVAHGEGTEVDKSVLEGVADPLVHIVRNSLDHGIESPEQRIAAGKPPQGSLRLHARHQGGEVWISVTDDGRGIDPAKMRAKAEALGWLTPDQPMSDAALMQLVFRPGFSTAEKVTGVSGRGVGMDVVRHNIEALRGRVELESQPGRGTTISIRLPLTLAIIDVMLVRVCDSLFGLPVLSLRESVSVAPEAVTRLPDGAEVVRMRERIIPVMGLETLFDLGPQRAPSDGLVAIVEHGERICGLRVDHLLGQRQVVIKPLDPYIAGIRGVSGCAVLGTGEVCLILDIRQLLEADPPRPRREAA